MLERVPRAGGGHRKKLEEAARLWASGALASEADDEGRRSGLDEQFAFFGIGVSGDEVVASEPPAPEFYLWPENVEAWALFLACSTQWRGSGMQREGLDYEGVEVVMRRRHVRRRLRDRRFAEIQLMEMACLKAWAEKAAQQPEHRA